MLDFDATWIGPWGDPARDVGVFRYRLDLDLHRVPQHLLLRVSADQRYILSINGERALDGPARGDLDAWCYEFADVAPYLRPGANRLEAVVWNFGYQAPMAQISRRTAFLVDVVDPSGEAPEGLRTPGAWRVAEDPARGFVRMHEEVARGVLTDVGPGETFDAARADEEPDWREPWPIERAARRGTSDNALWPLVPRPIPGMLYGRSSEFVIRDWAEGVLCDWGELLTAYPRLNLRGEPGAMVEIVYAEALRNPDGSKGDRDAVAGKIMRGTLDRVTLDAEGRATFEPLWWRTYRYVLVRGATVEAFESYETGYPYAVEGSFTGDDPRIAPLWETSVRTAQRCAGETYFDCPYYEQLMYAGDTRIQALLHYHLSSDRALPRRAVELFERSVRADGLTPSRYPSRVAQVIPPFALWTVLMRQDQRMYDRVPLSETEETDPVDVWGLDRIAAVNALGDRPDGETYWNFADWVPEWPLGVPPGGLRSTIHRLTLYLAHAATEMALERPGPAAEAKRDALWRVIQPQMTRERGLIRHRQDGEGLPSEHAEALWRILQRTLGRPMDPWPTEALDAANAARCTYYFAWYKHLAMEPDDYLAELGPWVEQIESGLTTFAENPEPTRSDCHAWSAHPALGFFRIVAGIEPTEAGWRRTRIAPRPGSLRRFDARLPHPDGELRVSFDDGRLHVETPVPAEIVWEGRTAEVEPGTYGF